MGPKVSRKRPVLHQAWIEILKVEELKANERNSKTVNSLKKARWAIEKTEEEFTEYVKSKNSLK